MQRMPELFNFVMPRAINRQKQKPELIVFTQPVLYFTLMDEAFIHDKLNRFGMRVLLFQFPQQL